MCVIEKKKKKRFKILVSVSYIYISFFSPLTSITLRKPSVSNLPLYLCAGGRKKKKKLEANTTIVDGRQKKNLRDKKTSWEFWMRCAWWKNHERVKSFIRNEQCIHWYIVQVVDRNSYIYFFFFILQRHCASFFFKQLYSLLSVELQFVKKKKKDQKSNIFAPNLRKTNIFFSKKKKKSNLYSVYSSWVYSLAKKRKFFKKSSVRLWNG